MLRLQVTADAPEGYELPKRLQGVFENMTRLLANLYIEGSDWAENFMSQATLGQVAGGSFPSAARYAEANPSMHVAHMLRVEVYDELEDLWLPLNGERVQIERTVQISGNAQERLLFTQVETYERLL